MFGKKIVKAMDFRYARMEHKNSRGILGVDGLETDLGEYLAPSLT